MGCASIAGCQRCGAHENFACAIHRPESIPARRCRNESSKAGVARRATPAGSRILTHKESDMATEIERDELGSSTQGASRTRGDTGATGEAQRIAEVGKAEAKAMWEDTKASVRSALNEKQSSTATDIGELAGALRNAARGINQDRPVAHIAAHAADSLDRL